MGKIPPDITDAGKKGAIIKGALDCVPNTVDSFSFGIDTSSSATPVLPS
jgi:hypothetical protein